MGGRKHTDVNDLTRAVRLTILRFPPASRGPAVDSREEIHDTGVTVVLERGADQFEHNLEENPRVDQMLYFCVLVCSNA